MKNSISFSLVPKLRLGNPVMLSSSFARLDRKLELPRLHSQAGAWERVQEKIESPNKPNPKERK
ncbi:hypothetical protein B0F87_10978 [Methylobacter tundripaludum]|uniref:Uncharacterized protein n=1 Tax=Methylobacter tundripaludum TaxID=173365 RepID=A0A2S6HAD9_9GAMM|nr:hypothetical protein B0F87_10978 [Methylobacter tundripaludum]